MKITIWSLLLISGTAFADNKVQLARTGPAEAAPVLATHYKCATNEHVRWSEVKLEARKIEALHECGTSDAHSMIAFEAKQGEQGVHLYTSAIISGDKISLSSEQLTIGKLKGGKHALLHRVDTRIDTTTQTRIDVCTFDTDGTPKCGAATAECPETGCQAPEIIKGALWLHTKDGRKRYTIE